MKEAMEYNGAVRSRLVYEFPEPRTETKQNEKIIKSVDYYWKPDNYAAIQASGLQSSGSLRPRGHAASYAQTS